MNEKLKEIIKAVAYILIGLSIYKYVAPIFIKDDLSLTPKSVYDKMQHDLDSVKGKYALLENTVKESDLRSDSLEKVIDKSSGITEKKIERKNEKLRIINNSTPTKLDSIMSKVRFNPNGN